MEWGGLNCLMMVSDESVGLGCSGKRVFRRLIFREL